MWALGKNWFFHFHKLSHANLILGGHSEHVLLSFTQSLGREFHLIGGSNVGVGKAEGLALLNNVANNIWSAIVSR